MAAALAAAWRLSFSRWRMANRRSGAGGGIISSLHRGEKMANRGGAANKAAARRGASAPSAWHRGEISKCQWPAEEEEKMAAWRASVACLSYSSNLAAAEMAA